MANLGIKLKCLSLNVQGIRNPKKRKALFRTFKQLNIDVIALQETYLIDSDLHTIEKEWKGSMHLSPGSTRSKGLLTLFNDSVSKEKTTILEKHERILTSLLELNGETFIFSNIYSPSDTIDNKINFLNY